MKVFGLGAPELFVILLVVVLLFGWKIFPRLGSSIGRFIGSFKHEVGKSGEFDDDEPSSAKAAPTPLLAPAPAPAPCAATEDVPSAS